MEPKESQHFGEIARDLAMTADWNYKELREIARDLDTDADWN